MVGPPLQLNNHDNCIFERDHKRLARNLAKGLKGPATLHVDTRLPWQILPYLDI